MGWFWDTVSGAEQARGEELDRRTRELDAMARARGAWTPENDAIVAQHRDQQEVDTATGNASVLDEFKAGAEQGLADTAATVNDTLNGVAKSALGFTWRALPWWVWAGAAGYLFWRFDLFTKARRLFK